MSHNQAGVILYGPPAAGKDTVTAHLDDRFELFARLKVGAGRTAGYRMGTEQQLAQLEASGQIIYANHRYSATYAIDRPELDRMLAAGQIPVVHLGQADAIDIVLDALPAVRWTIAELRCPREVAAQRIAARATGDTEQRLQAWDQTPPLPDADLAIDTSLTGPGDAAHRIAAAAQQRRTLIVPALHLPRETGGVDFALTRRYAERAAATWADYFLINGSTTRGDQLDAQDRATLLDLWADAVGPHRILACSWTPGDLTAATARAITPMAVLRGLTSPHEVIDFLEQLPAPATIYSHPQFGYGVTAQVAHQAAAAAILPIGGKISKITAEEISEIHRAAPEFALWHGSARHIRRSLAAGAAGIDAAPLTALLAGGFPPNSLHHLQRAADDVQAELDRLPARSERRHHLLAELRSILRT